MTQGSTRNCVSKASSQGCHGSLFCESEKISETLSLTSISKRSQDLETKILIGYLATQALLGNRGKIEATVNNARAALATIEQHGSLANLSLVLRTHEKRPVRQLKQMQANSSESEQMSKALKQLGWRFVGPTTCYSLMQADGIVNDHLVDCFRYPEIEAARKDTKKSI